MPKEKKKSKIREWVQSCPQDVVDGALARGAAHKDASVLNLHKLTPLTRWLLIRWNQGKLKEVDNG